MGHLDQWKQRTQKLTHVQMINYFMKKEQRIFNGERMVSSVNGGGKKRKACAKE